MLSSAAASQTLPALVFRNVPGTAPVVPPVAPPASVPAVASSFSAPGGINPQLFAKAKAALEAHRSRVRYRDSIGVVDFSLGSHLPRFHVVNLMNGSIESHQVAHGRGSDPEHSGFLEYFSNNFGSHASSNGAYITSDTYHGKYGLSMKVQGLDWSNSNAEARAIVIHNAWYAEPEMIASHGKLGRSEGCFAFSRDNQWKVMNRLYAGRMIYADKLA